MQEYIYIVVSQTGTNIAKAIKFVTRKPYNHVSIACDETLSEMYSFCRNVPERPLPASFNQEIVGCGTLGRFSTIPCEIYQIPVTHSQRTEILSMLEHFQQNRKIYSYSILGLCSIFFQINLSRKHKFVCSQFVAYILQKSGISLPKHASLCSPEDLRYIPSASLYYEGELNAYYHGLSGSKQELHPYARQGA